MNWATVTRVGLWTLAVEAQAVAREWRPARAIMRRRDDQHPLRRQAELWQGRWCVENRLVVEAWRMAE